MHAKAMVIARSEVMGASGDGVVEEGVESGSFVSVEGDVDESVVLTISVVVGGCTGTSVSGSSVPGEGGSGVVTGGGSVTSQVNVVGNQVVVVLTIGGGEILVVVFPPVIVVVSPGTVVVMITVVVATGASPQSSFRLNLIEIVIQMPMITHSAITVESKAYTSRFLHLNFSAPGDFLRTLRVRKTSRLE